jgi:transposase-like protein
MLYPLLIEVKKNRKERVRGAFPNEDAALKVIYLALRNRIAKWETVQHWKWALNHFTLLWEDRIQAARTR